MRDSHRVYASTRVSPTKLRIQFPWIDEVIDSMSGRSSKAKNDEFHDLRASDVDSVLAKIIRLKQAEQKSVLVVDSWEGALRNATPEGRKMLESAVMSELDQTKVSVILVSEAERADNLGYLVDGVVTLKQSELDGRRVRSLGIDKLRGFKVESQYSPFSLEKGRFTFLDEEEYENGPPSIVRNPEKIPHTATHYSTGSRELDQLLGGGVRKGAFFMIDTESDVSPQSLRLLINMIRSNFVNQGGACFSVSTGTFSSESSAEALRPYVGDKALGERVRIVEFNSQLPPKPWRLKLRGQLMSDLAEFYRSWNALKETSTGMMLTMNFDKLVQFYGEEVTLRGFTEIGEGLRDEGAFSIGISSRNTKVREEFLRQADYHIKVQSWSGHLLIYGVKPFTHIHGATFNFDKGYPSLDLIEIV